MSGKRTRDSFEETGLVPGDRVMRVEMGLVVSRRSGNTPAPASFGGSKGPLGCVRQERTTVGLSEGVSTKRPPTGQVRSGTKRHGEEVREVVVGNGGRDTPVSPIAILESSHHGEG